MPKDLKYQPIAVKTPDGPSIAAQRWGNAGGPEILFIHGFMQCHLSWARQVESALAREFHMVTYDLRGHGDSEKPLARERYRDGKAWAEELAAVIAAASLRRPVLVGWSYAGRVIADYLEAYGSAGIAGINFVNARTNSDPRFAGPLSSRHLTEVAAEDLATRIAATRTFLRACFSRQPTQGEFETMLGFNMMVPRDVRAAMSGRELDADGLYRSLSLPVLVTFGIEDKILTLEAARHAAAVTPGARLSLYEGIGHAPFWEDASRFNAELAAFVRDAIADHAGGDA
ncbi:MAG TPA: alpha/beta hydrolase [Stellaceae bacterium]|jgi:pimeloyl-ACP methyl ester carboxylesterase|nr:alpha/beta hydrolase [Stellaceae bacterium]